MAAHSLTPPAISRRNLRSSRASARRAQRSSAVRIAATNCPTGRDMACRSDPSLVVSSWARAVKSEALALGGTSVGRASFHPHTQG